MSANKIGSQLTWLLAALAWLVATLAVTESTHWPPMAVLPLTLIFGLLVGLLTHAIASGPTRSWSSVLGRATVALVVGVVVGELAAVVMFSGSIDRRLDEQAARAADTTPAVMQAGAELDRARQARTALDTAVDDASRRRDDALVVARCEFNPSPGCPQTHITGVPGGGPETRTANDFLGDAQRELDNATAERDRRAPTLDADIEAHQQALTQARQTSMKDKEGGLGARWAVMNEYTFGTAGAMVLRLLTIGFFALLTALPLVLKLWRGETSSDRGEQASAEVERAELEADTAIAVKRAEVRAAVETLWAEQELAKARFAVEAQTEIDREEQRRRVTEALEGPVQVRSERASEPMAELPDAETVETRNLPARVETGGTSLIPTIPDVTKAAARWLRPFVPPIVATAIDATTKPLRTAREVFEETEEIHFSLRRTHKVTVESEESAAQDEPQRASASVGPSVKRQHVLTERTGQQELRRSDGPRQLPPAE
ncbi:DUF4407 domain-containing protein [Mycobacterium sp. MMS18-G62]